MCPSEVSDISEHMWRDYRDDGLRVWGISSTDRESDLRRFRDQLGVEFPILFDASGDVHAQWLQELAFHSAAYPQDWLIDPEGRVAYANNRYEPDEIRALLDQWFDREP